MIVIIDYGVGNLFSLQSSLKAIGRDVVVSKDKTLIEQADKIILPGVGAFGDAIKKLKEDDLDEVVKREAAKGKPLLGICLGMQLLFESGLEYGLHEGLSLIKGRVIPIDTGNSHLKIPHMGWNALEFPKNKEKNELFKYANEGDCVYFVHSYFASDCDDSVIAVSQYGQRLTAAVCQDNVYGCQFHPEKSGEIGLGILKAFCEIGEDKR